MKKTKGKKKAANKHIAAIFIVFIIIAAGAAAAIMFMINSDSKDDNSNTDDGDTINNVDNNTEPITDAPPKRFTGLTGAKSSGEISEIFTYGTNLCISGLIKDNFAKEVSSISIILRAAYTENETGEDLYSYPAVYERSSAEGGISFSSHDAINSGINLENLSDNEYCLLVKISFADGSSDYYSLKEGKSEKQSFEDICYYTITKNGINQKIDIGFSTENNVSYLFLNAAQAPLPEDVYDIAIDAGHGGNDGGATNGTVCEADFTLDYSKALKAALEAKGYKVKLTRDGTEPSDEPMAYTMYNENGRVNIACRSKAKICLSIHLNSNAEKLTKGGIQIYQSFRSKTILSSLLLSSIQRAGCSIKPSQMLAFRIVPGIYTRAFSQHELQSAIKDAKKDGYEPYVKDTTTDYYFMIRELGGVATGAYVDGRAPRYGSNLYRNSLNGVECYIMELGFISVEEDLRIVMNERNEYIEGIVQGLDEHIAKQKEKV